MVRSPTAPDAQDLARSLGWVSVAEQSIKILLETTRRHMEELAEMREEILRIKEGLLSFQGK